MATQVQLNQLDQTVYNNSMSRQALINGNFDVWQRGTSLAVTSANILLADRYKTLYGADGWTMPTITHSRQLLTSGDIPGSFYHYRIATNGAGSGTIGNATEHGLYYRVEHGTKFLCGDGKKLTLSVWMRASSAKKVIINFSQRYGSGGSPSTSEAIKGVVTTLSTSWTKYTYTITTNTLAGKTFGTADDDYFQIRFDYIWNTTKGATLTDDSVSDETFGAANNIDIAQVQLCAGDVALPFMPKSFEDELRACQRYYEIGYMRNYGWIGASGFFTINFLYKVTKRTTPTVVISGESLSGITYNSEERLTSSYIRIYSPNGGTAQNVNGNYSISIESEL